MNPQLVIVAVLVAGATFYLARRAWRTWSAGKAGCPGGCGCSAKTSSASNNGNAVIPVEELKLRRGGRGSP
jgi:hypothetical protein